MTSREQRKSRRHGISRTALLLAAVLGCAMAAYAYLPMIDSSNGTTLRWANNAASYQISTGLSGSQFTAGQLSAIESTIQNAFAAWTSAPNTSVSVTWKSGTLPAPLIANDGHNVICFNCSDAAFSDANGSTTDTLAVTNISYQITSQGEFLYDTDILFNPAVRFVLPPTAGAANGSTISLQTVATHEVGHFLGLDHSAVQRAVMFPYISTLITTLSYDDVAAISSLYPKATPDYATGWLSGTISLATDGSGCLWSARLRQLDHRQRRLGQLQHSPEPDRNPHQTRRHIFDQRPASGYLHRDRRTARWPRPGRQYQLVRQQHPLGRN